MKKLLLKIFAIILFAGCGLTLSACNDEEPWNAGQKASQDLRIVAHVPQFEDVEVDTRGTKSNKESEVHNMIMFICDSKGNIIADPQYEASSKPIFTIIRSELRGEMSDKEEAQIVVIANLNDGLYSSLSSASIRTLSDIEDQIYNGCGTTIPTTGIPMMGIKVVDLRVPTGPIDPLMGTVIEVPLKCLYAKIVFNITVTPDQKIDGKPQSFELKKWTVKNVPASLKIGDPNQSTGCKTLFGESGCIDDCDGKETAFANGTMIDPVSSTKANKTIVSESAGTDKMTFSFYMPEHKVEPATTPSYTWSSKEENEHYRQYLKPKWVEGQKATYVEIEGVYTDHNQMTHDVTYSVYLGANNYDNYHIIRDHQYNNNIIIRGIKNSTSSVEGSVTYDHRVNIKPKMFNFNLQRETLLDCHWEIRPIRIKFNQVEGISSGYKLKVAINNPDDANNKWLRLEMPDNPTDNAYCDVGSGDLAYGKRRYFTTDLVSKTLTKNTKYTITYDGDANKEYTIWTYADEYYNKTAADASYPNPSFRQSMVTCQLLDDSDNEVFKQDYIFQQYNVFKVSNNGNNYYIEYFEEYLYNFDSKVTYDQTTDGMAWGMLNTELSNKESVVALNNVGGSGSNTLKNKVKAGIQTLPLKYDFYMQRDIDNNGLGEEGLVPRDAYSGKTFTQEIANNSKSGIGTLATNETPKSAVEYALNKNKRKSDGTIDISNIKWYLPAIDEIEEICKGGYNQFDVFQDKLYWSSQPAFKRSLFEFYDRGQNAYYLPYFKEDSGVDTDNNITYGKGRARATKVDDTFNNVKSESYGIQHATQAVGTAPLIGSFNFPDGPRYFECYPGNSISYTGSYTYLFTTHKFNLQFEWQDPDEDQLVYYRETGKWLLPDTHNSYSITNSHNAKYNATWKDWYYFYDEGNCSRDEIHRVRCVYFVPKP